MNGKLLIRVCLAALAAGAAAVHAQGLKAVSESTVSGFPFPESVGCDAKGKVFYVSQFVSALKPQEKDGKGRISKVGLDGKMIEEQFLPAQGGVLNKPKGIWVAGNRLWVTDIDVVWVFDTKTKKGRKVDLPGAQFANDPAVKGKTLYVSDNRGDALQGVAPPMRATAPAAIERRRLTHDRCLDQALPAKPAAGNQVRLQQEHERRREIQLVLLWSGDSFTS